MIKDLSAKLIAAVTEINQQSRKSFATEQQEIATKKAASAKMHTFMPKQPAPKADPAAVSAAKKMAEEAEGSVPKTPREKELAAKHGNKNRITMGDVLKARGVVRKEEVEEVEEATMGHAGKVTMKHVNASNATPQVKAAIKKAAPDIKSYGDRAAALNAAGIKREEVEQADENHKPGHVGFKKLAAKTSPALAAWIGRKKFGKKEFQAMGERGKEQQAEGFMDTMKKLGNKVLDAVAPGDDKLLDNLHKSVHGKNAPNVPKPKPKLKLAHDYVKEEKGEKGETAAHEKAEKKKEVPEYKKMLNDPYAKEKSKFNSKQISTGTVYSRKYEEVQSVGVKHEQFGAGKTLPQFAEDLSWIDVMFDEGIKRVYVEDLELTEEKAVHPDAIHVSDAGGGKYKVHAVGSNFSHGVKVGEHLTDTHLDDFSEMGGKVKTVKAPKKD